jgi:hypothetical protein
MKKISKVFLFVALAVVLVTAACGADQGGEPTLSGTLLPSDLDLTSTAAFAPDTTETAETQPAATVETTAETSTAGLETPTASGAESLSTTATATVAGVTAVGTARTPVVPVTGMDIVLVDCQFCVDTLAHALLVLPDTATFEVVAANTTTTTTTTSALNTNCSTIEVNNGKQVVLCSGPEMTPITLNICMNRNTCTSFPVQLLACPLTQAPDDGTGATTTPTTGAGTVTAVPVITNTPAP